MQQTHDDRSLGELFGDLTRSLSMLIRQELELQGIGNASGPEFWAQVDALGKQAYYPPANFS